MEKDLQKSTDKPNEHTQSSIIKSKLSSNKFLKVVLKANLLTNQRNKEERKCAGLFERAFELSDDDDEDILKKHRCTTNLTSVKRLCRLKVPLDHIRVLFVLPKSQPQLFKNQEETNRILLYGPTGCGKTQIVNLLCHELKARSYFVTPANLMSKYVGATEKAIQKIFDYLHKQLERTVLFIDNIDCFCRERSEKDDEHIRRIKIEFLNQLSREVPNSKLIVIGATSVPWEIDSSVVRRFQQQIYVGIPDIDQRNDLLQFFLGNNKLEICKNHKLLWTYLLRITAGYSIADLKEVVRVGLMKPVKELADVKVWSTYNGLHSPAFVKFEEGNITCPVYELPYGSVRTRPISVIDFIYTCETAVHSSITNQDLENHSKFLKKHTKG